MFSKPNPQNRGFHPFRATTLSYILVASRVRYRETGDVCGQELFSLPFKVDSAHIFLGWGHVSLHNSVICLNQACSEQHVQLVAEHKCRRVEVNEQKILSISTPMPLICTLNNSNSLHYLNRGSKLSIEENDSSVGKNMKLIGTSSVEGLDSLRTLRMVESSNLTESPVWPGWQYTWNTIFPKWPMILLLNCVPNLILLFINNANIQALHHQKTWIWVGEFRAGCLFRFSQYIMNKSPCRRNPLS